MEVRGIRWLGVRTDRMAEMRAFATGVLGLRVGDEDTADFVELATADGSKVELLGELRVLPDGYAWQHFRAPDGHVYELTADPSSG